MNACLRSWVLGALALAFPLSWESCPGAALTTLEYRIMGSRLRVTPEAVTVPRHVAGSVLIQVVRGDGTVVPAEEAGFGGGRVEATLRGPSFPAQRLVAEPGQPLFLPPLRLAGDYQLDDVRWVQAGGTVVPATPGSIPVRVFDEVLVSRVTSRPLSSEEIREKGIVIDDTNFRVVEFEVALLLRGRTFQVRLPVVAPRVKLATEIIPAAELEERLVEAEQLNRELARSVSLPPEIRAEMPEFTLQPIQFEDVLDGEEEEKRGIPITGLLAIPGNIGFLNQFFSVQLFTENAAPEGSGLSVDQVRARIRLPQGPDGLPARSYEQPGDDPLRMARIGAGASVQTNLPVLLPGADGQRETEDDVSRLNPGQTGSAEFLVEGLREGLHLLEMDLEADLHGLAAGVVRVRGRAVGSVLVRNANFSMTFAHPQTVRVGEPYEAHVTLLNTGEVPAQATRISLNRLAISGAVLLSEETVELGDLAPGDSATATFRLRAQRTGSVFFSNLTTSDDSVRGRLNLTLGVDSRGVPLSPDVIVYPDWVQTLPRGVFDAANRVLGQALSVATAGRLPDGLRRVARVAVERHGVELAEAGQRLRYGDDPSRVLTDLLLDWQGARHEDLGFDQILRESDAGREWREAMAAAIDVLDTDTTVTRLRRLAPSLAGLGQSWRMAASGSSSWSITLTNLARTRGTSATASGMEGALVYRGLRGDWAIAPTNEPMVFVWTAAAGAPATTLTAFEVLPEGRVAWWRWEVPSPTAPVRYEFQPGRDQVLTRVDTLEPRHLDPIRELIQEEPPAVISVRQDISVVSDRAPLRCPIREYGNWGSVVAVLFSKPMTPEEAENAARYRLEESDNGARTVRLQPGGRVALLQLHRGIASFSVRPREYRLTVGSVPDPRGNRSVESRHEILTVPAKGTSVRGLVLGLDGLPVPGAPVTLTMTDRVGNKCVPVEYRAGQVFTDERGRFDLDFILADVAFTLGAIDTARMSEEDARAILSVLLEAARPASDFRQRVESLLHETSVKESMLRVFQSGDLAEAVAAAEGVDRATYTDYVSQDDARTGSELVVVLRFRGRGRVEGRVVDARGAPMPGAAVNLFPAVDSRELGRGVFADSEGWFRFEAVPLGEFSVETSTTDGRTRTVSGRLSDPGQHETLEINVPDVPVRTGVIAGWVTEATGAAHVGARVFVARRITSGGADEVSGSVETDQDGAFRLQGIPEGPWMIVAVSSDGTRRTEVRSTSVTAGTSVDLHLPFERTAVVRGVVRLWEGTPAPRARVGGGSRVVVTDDQGRFELPGVPPGLRTLIAGLDGPDTPDGITRTASVQVRVQPGANDSVEFRLPARGRIRGVVYDASGERRVPGVRVSIPQPAGFLWVLANGNGEYEFNGLGLGGYLVSAPSPPIKVKADELASQAISALGEAQRGGNGDEAAALVGQLANLYAQGSLGRLTTTPFTPGSWGFNTTQIDYDGQTVVANVRYLPSGRLSGTVVNHQDVPIGAEVKVTAFGPTKNGGAGMVEIGPFGSDPESGRWSASGFLTGPYRVGASSPLLVGRANAEGVLSPEAPARTNVLLRFPPQAEVTGRLTGLVLDAQGTAISNAAVHIDFTPDYVISTDTEGRFDTQLRLPARTYRVVATNLVTGALAGASIDLVGGITNFVTLHLLDRGTARIRVLRANGQPAANAEVTLTRLQFPSPSTESAVTDPEGLAVLGDLWEGEWSVAATALEGVSRSHGLASLNLEPLRTNEVQVTLGASGTVTGTFVEANTGRPIEGAQVTLRFGSAIGAVAATAPTRAQGIFEIQGLPLGPYAVSARNPVNGRVGVNSVSIPSAEARVAVTLVEVPLGEVRGTVTRDGEPGGQPGIELKLRDDLGLAPEITVTSGPAGEFVFRGVPVGSFRLTAHDPERQLQASANGGFAPAETMARLDVALPGVGAAEIRVLHPDGLTPAVGVAVQFLLGRERVASDTDAQGVARLSGLPLGQVEILAASRQAGESSSRARTNLILNAAGQVASVTLILPGVGRVQGRVLDASGRPVASARLDLVPESGEWRGGPRQAVSERDGSFALEDLPLSAWTLKATVGGLAAQTGGRFLQASETSTVELRLGPSGGIRGVIQDENGQEMRNLEVAFFFTSQSGSPAFARAVANGVGEFAVADLPVATPILLRVNVPAVDGVRTLLTNLPAGGGVVDVGVLRLDQLPPQLTASTPLPGAVEVATRPTLHLEFSEAIQPGSVSTNGVSLRYGDRSAPIRLALEPGTAGPNSRLVIVPLLDLESATAYTLVVAGGDQVDASGRPISLGPEDLEGRPLPRTELLGFTVRDSRPPQLVSAYPEPQALDIEPLATLRWEFDEPLRTNAVTATLSRNGTTIPATLALNANGRLLALVPNSPLLPDTTYQTRLAGVQDLAGNQAPERLGEFSTLDTRGPSLTAVRLRGGQRPVANATVTVEALMNPPDPDAVVRWSRNGVALGLSTNGPQHTFAVRLPAEGTVRISAVGVDRAGNAGEAGVLELRVGPNDRPTVELARIEPLTGPLETGRRFGFSVLARDDATVSAVRLEGKGALSFTRTLFAPPNGVASPLVMEFPAEAEASGEVEISAVALDDSGASSDPAQLVFETLDTTPPRLQLNAPLDREALDPRLPLALTLRASDNGRSLRWTVRLSGAVTAEQRQSWAPDPQQELAQSLVFSLTNALDGGSLTLTSILVDAAGNERAESRHYTLRSVLAPRIVRVVAADSGTLWDHAANTPISPWSSVVIGFDRVVDLTRSPSNRVSVTTLSGGVPPHEVRLTPSYAEVVFQGASLTPGDTLAVRVLPGWLGVNGQPVTLADGSDLPDAGALFDFEVAKVSGLSVTNDQPVVPGQWLTVAVHHDPAPWQWTLSVNGTPVPRQIPNVGRTEFWMQVPTNAASVVVQPRSEHLGREPLLLPPVRFALRPRDADDDLDGLPNAWEADRTSQQFGTKFDPFNASDAAADFDFDRSMNLVEYRLGTDPFHADTDRDGLADGSESQANGCPSPFDADSDDDGIGDRDDLAPCLAGESIALTPLSLSAPEGEATTHTITATAAGLTLLGMDFAPGTPRPAFISFADFTHTGTNPIMRRLLVRPSFADAGTHAFTIQVTARRNVSIVTTNLTLGLVVEDRSNERHTRWARAADGDWGDAANWTAGLPGLGTNAVIDLPGTYNVRVTGTQIAESLTLGAATGRQALRLEGGTLDLNGASAVLPNGRLVIERFGRLRGPGGLRVDGTFDLSNGTKEGSGLLRILPGGRFSISNTLSGITATLSSPVVNQGLITISTNSTLYLAGASLTNEVEGRILQAGGQLRGNYRESLENRGEWSVPGAGALAVSGLIVRQAGRLTVDQGDFEFWGGTVEFLVGSTNRGTGRLLLSSNPARSGAPLRFDAGVVISSGVLTNEADQTWSNLSLQQGTIEGAGTLVVTQQWMAGNASLLGTGSLRLPVGSTVLVPASRYLVLERSVESDADWLLDTNASILMGKSTFRSRGQIELHGGAHWRASSGVESGSLEIHGTLRKTGVDRSVISGVAIRNLGRVLIEAGSLQVASRFSNAGRIHLELGATLEWQASAEYDAASYLGGPGSVVFASGSHDLLGTFEPLGPWRVDSGEVRVRRPMPPTTRVHTRSGRVTLDQPQTFASMDLAQGEWTFAHDVTLTESGSLSATRLRGPGRWIIATNATVSVASSGPSLELECLNQGRLELAPDTLLRLGGARLVNRGELTLVGAATFLGVGGTTNEVFNHGLFRAGTNTLRFSSVGFSALGRQILQPTEVSLDRGTNATDWIMPAGGRTVFNESFRHLPGSHLGGAGDVDFTRGTQDVAGHMSVTGTLRFQGADVRFAAGFTNLAATRLSSGSVVLAGTNLWRDLTFAGGRLAPQELLRLSRSLDWTAGTLEGAGRLRIEPTASAQARGYGGQTLASTLEVAGTFSITNDTRVVFRDGALHVLPGGVHDLGAAVAYWISGNASGALSNDGLIRKTGPGVVDLDLEIDGDGEWNLQGGRLDLGAATRLAGAWSIAIDTELRLEGATNRIAAGASWASDGTIRVARAGTLQLEADTDFGSLEVVLAASLQVSGEHALRSGVDGSLSLTGPSITVEGPVEVAGNLEVGPTTTVRIDDELRLTTGATLTNRGRRDAQNRSNVRVRGFPSLGGTVSGIPPDVIPASSPLRLVPGGADRLKVLGLSPQSTDTPGRWHLNWWCAAGVATRIESSTDLAVWHALAEIPAAANEGWHAVPVEAADEETRFFRIRETEW